MRDLLSISRRDFGRLVVSSTVASVLGCRLGEGSAPASGSARLVARPGPPTGSVTTGVTEIRSAGAVDALLFVPAQYDPSLTWPLVLALHGAGIGATGPITFLSNHASAHGFLLLAPQSRASTWDVLYDDYGRDIAVMDSALAWTFENCNVASDRVFIEGFSDGASYALGVGLTNGDLFARVVAFSPGFIPPRDPRGKPPIFVSHGRDDPVLPIEVTRRQIVPLLESEAYDVTYVEYDGQHSVPLSVAQQAMEWLMAPPRLRTMRG